MTYHPSSLAEFSRRISRVSECLLSGASLDRSVCLLREQFEATAIAVQIGTRSGGQGRLHLFEFASDELPPSTAGEDRLTALADCCHARHAVSVGESDGARCGLWIFRPLDAEDFSDEDDALCDIFAAQLRRGLELSARLGESELERMVYADVMDRLSVGVILLDAGGRIVRSSARAEAALGRREGLQANAGRLRATSSREDALLQAAIRAATAGEGGKLTAAPKAISLSRSASDRGLGVIVQSIAPEGRSPVSSAVVAVYIRDPDSLAEVEGDLVRQLFDLTPAEAAVARRLASGLSLEDAAVSLDISRNTARAHLRSIFSKSGISRQTELVRLLLSSAAVLGSTGTQAA